ncbi:MAG: hypothetical protein EHM41_20460, partial [Chloroflexi bacterium]
MEKTRTSLIPVRLRSQLNPLPIGQAKSKLSWSSVRNGFLVWLVFITFLALVQFSTPNMPDNDGFYHI